MSNTNLPRWRELAFLWVVHIVILALLCWGGISTAHAIVAVAASSMLALLTGARLERYHAELRQTDADLQRRIDLESDDETEVRITNCPNCGEPNHPEFDCEFFNCNRCRKKVCENCASGGLCERCDGEVNGTVTVRFK